MITSLLSHKPALGLGMTAAVALQLGALSSPASALEPIAQVEVLTGGTLEFYEPQPGILMTVKNGLERELYSVRGLTPSAEYEYLSGEEAPQALLEAEDRAGVNDPVSTPDSDPSGVAPTSQFQVWAISDITREAFIEGNCRGNAHVDTFLNATGDHRTFAKDVEELATAVRADTGRVRIRAAAWDCGHCVASFGWGSGIMRNPDPYVVYLDPGKYWASLVSCRNCTVETKVTEAEGTYDLCTVWHK